MKPISLIASLLSLPAVLGACSNQQLSPDFGNAVKHNIAMQTVNPDRHPAVMDAPGYDGARTAAALERYQKGKVKPPQQLGTSNLSPSSGGASK